MAAEKPARLTPAVDTKFGGARWYADGRLAGSKMNEHEFLTRINALLHEIADEVVAAVDAAGGWDELILSVVWADDESGVFDIVIESTHRDEKKYHSASAAHARLIDLWDVSRQLKEPFNELLLTIGPDGTCNTKFGYP